MGFILLDASHTPIYANSEAIRVLLYPANITKKKALKTLLAQKLRSVFMFEQPSPEADYLLYLTSGKRTYLCRAIHLTSDSNDPIQPRAALLLERKGRGGLNTLLVAEQYRLTPRERKTVELLVQGLTTKEIATAMQISPHTVKTFLRMSMTKMGVCTRSGIVGKILEQATRLSA